MSKQVMHTPGPWAFCNDTLCQANGNYLHLGKWVESPGLGRAAEANKRLIAAAPELLAVLKDVASIPALQNAPVMERIRKVIAKAESC